MMKRLLVLFLVLLIGPSVQALAAAGPSVLSITVDRGVPLTLSGAASSVFIANPDIADVQVMSPTSIMIFGKRTGETTFMATDAQGNTLAHRTVRVSQDLSDLRLELDAAIPGNKISVKSLPNGLVLTGEAKDPAAVADAYKMAQRYLPALGGDIINRVRVVGSNQIMIRVRFAEVQRSIDNTLGINWQSLASTGGFVFGLGTGSLVNAVGTGALNTGTETGLFPRPNNTTLSQPNDVLGFSHVGKRLSLNGMIDALAQDGLVTILAEPNLTAMSGETATFLAGGEFPIPIPQGNGTISIEFKNYGISLAFTPTLISENRINLHVKPEVSELTQTGAIVADNITVPALTTRKAETTIEVASGQSFAIAGLMSNNQAQTVTKYPLLGDLPVLGALFRSDHFQNGQTELVVIITPFVVKPNGEQQLALPTDGLAPPNEEERLLGLRYSSPDPAKRLQSGDRVGERIDPARTIMPALPPQSAVTPTLQDDMTASMAPGGNAPDASPVAPVAAIQPETPPAEMPVPATTASYSLPPESPEPVKPMVMVPTVATESPMPIHLKPMQPTTVAAHPQAVAPAGPGGFILE